MRRRTFLGLLPAAVLAGCGRGGLPYRGPGARRFDRDDWRHADLGKRTRSDMTADLLDRHPLTGLTREEVVELLGPPEPEPHKFADYELVYVLGPDRSMTPIDFEWLLIKLDGRGRVAQVMVTTD